MSTDAASGQTSEKVEDATEILRKYYDADRDGVESLGDFARKFPDDTRTFYIDYEDLERAMGQATHDIADDVLRQPEEWRQVFQEAIAEYPLPTSTNLTGAQVRFANLPNRYARDIGSFRGEDRGRLRKVTGQITRRTEVRPKLTEAVFECKRCGTLNRIPQSGEGYQEPHECESCERQGPYDIDYDRSGMVNAQRIRIQLPPEKAAGGTGEHVDVALEGDLVETADVGDRVEAAVVMNLGSGEDDSRMLEWQLVGEHVTPTESDFEDITIEPHLDTIQGVAASDDPYQTLVESIIPSHFGDETVKLAVALQLFGGVRKELPDGSVKRGDSHILWVGDPGTNKSGLLQYVTELAPRAVYTSGKSSTGAGLTAAAVKDDFGESGGWTIKGGAMVRAHKGVACIDELDKMEESDRAAMFEALAEQSISVAKAGISATLPTRTRLLAAANPLQGRFDDYAPVPEQIDLDPALISRFDLIFTAKDKPEDTDDEALAEHILAGHQTATGGAPDAIEPTLTTDEMRAYIAHARETCTPTLTDAAREAIRDFYVDIREEAAVEEGSDDSAVPITARKIEAIVRLAEAAARVRLSETVEPCDAELAVDVVMESLTDVGVDPETGEFDADVIETGQSKSQRDRYKTMRSIIAETEGETKQGAPVDVVLEKAEEACGISRGKAKHAIKKLKGKGEIYEPEADHLRTS